MDVNTLAPEAIQTRVHMIMDGYHTVVIKAAMNGLYRARKNIDGEPFLYASDLWYPPAAAVVFEAGSMNQVRPLSTLRSGKWCGF